MRHACMSAAGFLVLKGARIVKKYTCIITSVVINYASIVIEYMGRFPSGQRGQTVNLLQLASMVRIHLCPLKNLKSYDLRFLCYSEIIN